MIEIKFQAGLHSTFTVQYFPSELGNKWAAIVQIGEIRWSVTTNEWMALRSAAIQEFGVYSTEFAAIEGILLQLVNSQKSLGHLMNN